MSFECELKSTTPTQPAQVKSSTGKLPIPQTPEHYAGWSFQDSWCQVSFLSPLFQASSVDSVSRNAAQSQALDHPQHQVECCGCIVKYEASL